VIHPPTYIKTLADTPIRDRPVADVQPAAGARAVADAPVPGAGPPDGGLAAGLRLRRRAVPLVPRRRRRPCGAGLLHGRDDEEIGLIFCWL
jgi:hypothetical protein